MSLSPILPPPSHVSLFTQPKMPRWLDSALLIYAIVISGTFGFTAKGFGTIAFYHPGDPNAMKGMMVAGICFIVSAIAMFTASQCFTRLAKRR